MLARLKTDLALLMLECMLNKQSVLKASLLAYIVTRLGGDRGGGYRIMLQSPNCTHTGI